MTIERRTEREASRSLQLELAAGGVEELRQAAVAAEQKFASDLDARRRGADARERVQPRALPCCAQARRATAAGSPRSPGVKFFGPDGEAHVMASLQAVIEVLDALRGSSSAADTQEEPVTSDTGMRCSPSTRKPSSGPLPKAATRGSW